MSENPVQLLFQGLGKVSECIQINLSRFFLRHEQDSSSSLPRKKTPLITISAPDHLRQPDQTLNEVSPSYYFSNLSWNSAVHLFDESTERSSFWFCLILIWSLLLKFRCVNCICNLPLFPQKACNDSESLYDDHLQLSILEMLCLFFSDIYTPKCML